MGRWKMRWANRHTNYSAKKCYCLWYRWQPKDDKCIIIEYRFWMIPHDWTQGVLIRIRKQCHFVWHWNWILWITKSITYHDKTSTITELEKMKTFFSLFISNVNAFCKQILEMKKWNLKFNALHVALDSVISNVTWIDI